MTAPARHGVLLPAGLLVLAAVSCRPGNYLEVRAATTTATSITFPDGAASVQNSVRTEGKDTIIAFRGKTVIVRNLVGYTAVITPASMKVQTGPVTVSLDERELSVTGTDYRTSMTLWKDMEGQRVDMLEGRKIIVTEMPPYVVVDRE